MFARGVGTVASVMNAGCCKILLHPSYGSAVYPATIFATAPQEVMDQILLDPNLVACAALCGPSGAGTEEQLDTEVTADSTS
jgi:hypothetical protein